MPVAVPLLAASLSVDAWAIARPLLVMVLTPLVLGMAVFHLAPHVAAVVRPRVKAMAAVAAVALLVLCGVLFGHGFLASFGSFAIGSQVLYLAIITTMGLPLLAACRAATAERARALHAQRRRRHGTNCSRHPAWMTA